MFTNIQEKHYNGSLFNMYNTIVPIDLPLRLFIIYLKYFTHIQNQINCDIWVNIYDSLTRHLKVHFECVYSLMFVLQSRINEWFPSVVLFFPVYRISATPYLVKSTFMYNSICLNDHVVIRTASLKYNILLDPLLHISSEFKLDYETSLMLVLDRF